MSSRLQPRIMIRSRHIDFPIKLICESQNFTTRKYNRITVNKQSIYIKLSSVTWTWLVVTGRIDLHGVSLARFPAIDRVMTSPCPHLVSTPTGGATATPTTPLTHVTVDCNISVILHNIITTFDNQLLLPYHIFFGGGGILLFLKKRYYLLRVYVTTVVLVYSILTKIRFHVRSFNYKLLVSFSVAFFFWISKSDWIFSNLHKETRNKSESENFRQHKTIHHFWALDLSRCDFLSEFLGHMMHCKMTILSRMTIHHLLKINCSG